MAGLQHSAQQQQQHQPQAQRITDLRPTPANSVNSVFIILEKGPVSRVSEAGATICTALVADPSGSVHLQLWGGEVEAFQPGDIVRLSNGIFSFQKTNLVLRAGKKGQLEKIGEFTMVFAEAPNMSRLQWVQDPTNPKVYMPRGLGGPGHPAAPHPPYGAPSMGARGPHA